MSAPAARASLAAWDRATRLFHKLRAAPRPSHEGASLAVHEELVDAERDWLRWSGAACCPSDTAHPGMRGGR